MLFVAIHRHTAESCPQDDPVGWHVVISPEHAAKCGVKVHGNYTAPPEHVSFHVVEADEYAQVVEYFRPVLTDGDITIIDMDKEAIIDANSLHSKNKPTPWNGWKVKGVPICTIVRGHIQMRDGEPVGKPIGRMQKPILD